MKYSVIVGRVLLGLVYFVFGLNGFFNFIPMPPMPEKAGAFMMGLAQSGYFFPFLKGTEVIGGLLLLTGFFVPLSLVILMPITLNILFFHLALAPDNVVIAIAMLVIQSFLMWKNCEIYKPMFKAK